MHEPAAVQSHIHRGKELLQCWQGHTKHTAPFVDLSIAECFLAVRITFEAYDGVYLTERFSRGTASWDNSFIYMSLSSRHFAGTQVTAAFAFDAVAAF